MEDAILTSVEQLKYVCEARALEDGVWTRILTSDAVDINQKSDEGFLRQATTRLESGEPLGLATVTLGR